MEDGFLGSGEAAASNPLRILVVDDEALLLFYLSDLIEDLGHIPVCAGSGAEALLLLTKEPRVDLVIIDQSMPEMNGTDLAAAIIERHPHIPVVLASGYGESVRQDGVALPCLAKPFAIADLENMITTVAQVSRG